MAVQTLSPRIDWSGIRTQWLLALLLIFLVMSGIWASIFAQGIKPSRAMEIIPVSLRSNAQADYSSDPTLSFRPVSLAIVEDVLGDELTSDEEVADRLADFEANLKAPIPSLNPDNQSEEQESIPPSVSDKNESEVEINNNGEDEGDDNKVVDVDDTSISTPPVANNQPDVLDPNVNFLPENSGNVPGQSDDSPGNSGNAPGQSDDSPGNSGNAPGQSDDSPGNSGNAPGQSGDSPGNSGNAPGQSGDSPGNSGNAPGQSGDSPGNSGNAPGQSGDSPGNSGNAPGKNKDKDK